MRSSIVTYRPAGNCPARSVRGYPLASKRRVAVLANRPSSESLIALPAERTTWEADIRTITGRKKHKLWSPASSLDPPPLLGNVVVILVSPKKPSSVGSVARALSCFECPNLLLVNPKCDHLSRSARNSSKGAQYLLWRTTVHASLSQALTSSNAAMSVAFSRWVDDDISLVRIKRSMTDLQESAEFKRLNKAGARTALVFGREVDGLTVEEVKMCDFVCSLPIGRLQESLSVSHAVSLALAPLFESQLKLFESGDPKLVRPLYPDHLASGVEADDH